MGFNVKFEEFHTGCQKSISLQIEKYWLADGVCFVKSCEFILISKEKKTTHALFSDVCWEECMLGGMYVGRNELWKTLFFFETDSFLSIKISELDIVSVTWLISRD